MVFHCFLIYAFQACDHFLNFSISQVTDIFTDKPKEIQRCIFVMFAIKQYGQQYDDVTQKKLREYKVWLIENYKPKTVNLRLRALNCYLESIGKEKLKLPFVRVQQKSYLENVISEADYEYFKSCLKKDDEMFWYFVIRFLAATGARVSELIQIKAEHVKLGHLDLYSKGGKLRRIYIPKELQNKALSWLAEKQQESGFIFLNKYGERITTRGISGQLKKLAVRYNINSRDYEKKSVNKILL